MSAERRDEAVQFEIPDLAAAARLTRLLAEFWHVSLHDQSDINLVSAVLRSDPLDLAVLLRKVEAWIREESLCAIRFEVDGREYVVAAGEADWAAIPAAIA